MNVLFGIQRNESFSVFNLLFSDSSEESLCLAGIAFQDVFLNNLKAKNEYLIIGLRSEYGINKH
jgi:hypothetical protein